MGGQGRALKLAGTLAHFPAPTDYPDSPESHKYLVSLLLPFLLFLLFLLLLRVNSHDEASTHTTIACKSAFLKPISWQLSQKRFFVKDYSLYVCLSADKTSRACLDGIGIQQHTSPAAHVMC